MGESVDFVKALTEAFKDTTVQDVFKSMFNPVMDDLAKDFENKMDVWHKKFVDDMRSKMDALRSNLKMKDDKIKNLEVEIAALKHDQDRLEQYTRRTSLRISGLPEGNKEDVCAKVLDLCNKKLRIPVEPNEIERVNRLGRPGGSPRRYWSSSLHMAPGHRCSRRKLFSAQGDGIRTHRGRLVLQLAWRKRLTTLKRHLPQKRPTILQPMTTTPTTILTPTLIIPRFLFRRTWHETDNSCFGGPDGRRKARKYVIVGQLMDRLFYGTITIK